DRLPDEGPIGLARRGGRTAGVLKGDSGLGVGVVQPVMEGGKVVGILKVEDLLDYRFASHIRSKYGLPVVVMDGDRLQATTFSDPTVVEAVCIGGRGDLAAMDERDRVTAVRAAGTVFSVAALEILPAGDSPAGVVLLGLSHRTAHRALALLALLNGGVAAALLAAMIIICVRVASNIVRPVGRLSEAAEAAAAGDLDREIAVEATDEIGDLADSFRHMIAIRKQAEEELRQHRDRLEELVAERTGELALSNRDLQREMGERKRVEQELRNGFERFRAVMDGLEAVVCVADMETDEVLFINRYCRTKYGDMVGGNFADTMTAAGFDLTSRCPVDRLIDSDGRPAGVCVREDRNPTDGQWYECRIQAIRWIDGRIARLTVAANITARREAQSRQARLEEQLRQSQKMEAIGELAGGVAHDFNNLLTGIMGNAQLLDMRLARESEESGYATEIVRAATRAADLTRQLLAFSRRGPVQTVPVDVHEVVAEVVKLLSHSIDRRIELAEDLQASPSCVMGDPSHLQNAILNLAVNARDAMPEGGRLQFATRNVVLDEEYCRLRAGQLYPGPHVEISVSDTGVGMDAELQERIFEPFFTTKSAGKGTGLGLATVYGCVRAHGGIIDVYSEVGKGSTFKVLLPLAEVEAEAAASEGEPIKGAGHILLVDDEDLVRNFAAKALRGLGYTVTTAADGVDALDLYRRRHGEFDAVILDLIMPRLSGQDTFRLMKEIDPHVRV
ncbi:MAG: hybrid sensor histidine kinase/response regulator, partial [Planctomycetota bacterium]